MDASAPPLQPDLADDARHDGGAHAARRHAAAASHPGGAAGPLLPGRLAVGIATTGRAPVLTPTLRALAAQTRRPDLVLISAVTPDDVAPGATDGLPFETRLLTGPKGSCPQRNTILDALSGEDIVLFIDDDFLMAPDWLAGLEALMTDAPDIVLVTGKVVADGVTGPGLSHDEAAAALARATPGAGEVRPAYSGYGCNFALRMAPIRAHGLRFDEALPLYGWLEDIDFSRQLAPHGRLVRHEGLVGVHLGTKMARSPGLRLGYSQVANPVYLVRKGTMTRRHAADMMGRNLASNLYYTPRPRPWADSRGRLRGNLLALWDWVRGRLDPGRVRDI